ncbi:MAG: [FeFe] hydrogenase H-cluster maturation GTPase HydF [Candidatus Omnitrophica bacterium]|nr:[FeFe] hydrogenase H-cluster maturation GTPase HydF [Candidatus Omnitrophota bacterium]
MYSTPVSNRLHIGIFGRRNVGKSSLINAITGQSLAIVSEIPGTTTDPVYKTMEILPIGPCMLIDTAGIDDEGVLGKERVEKTQGVLRKTDVGLIVVEPGMKIGNFENELVKIFKEKKLPYLFVINKCDIGDDTDILEEIEKLPAKFIGVSSKTLFGIEELKKEIMEIAPADWSPVPLVKDIIKAGDTIILVCPIDSAMPQGRLILPQVQVLRDVLDANAVAYVTKETALPCVMENLKKAPRLVITDSQVFETVKDMIPEDIPLTSFSVIFARHKGDLAAYIKGVEAVETLADGDEILIAEACTHHVQPEDIGRSKIPTWLLNRTGKDLVFDVTAGGEFKKDLSRYKMIITCGACMVNRREMMHRVNAAEKAGVPITNYGILIAHLSGILDRVVAPFNFEL